MRVIILTQYYIPEIGAPQRRLSELAERLVNAGHSVTVLTAMPNYPHGQIYSGYGGIIQRETINGVNVIRAAIYATTKSSLIHRLLNYFSFVFSSALIGTLTLRRADFLMVESPPLFLGFSALWLNALKGTRLIFNVSDLWPESAVRLGITREHSFSHRLGLWLEKLCYKRAWLVTGQSRGIVQDIENRFPGTHTFRLSNGVDIEKFGPSHFDEAYWHNLRHAEECVAIYAGLHGFAQGLSQLVEAAQLLRDEDNLRLVLIGNGPEKAALIHASEELNLPNIQFRDPVPASDVPALLAASDIIVVPLKSYIPGAVPSKLYEAMASGKPVIVIATGEPAEIVQDSEAGIVVEPGNVEGIAHALRQLRDAPSFRATCGSNGRKTVEQHFNRETIVSQFIEHLENNIK